MKSPECTASIEVGHGVFRREMELRFSVPVLPVLPLTTYASSMLSSDRVSGAARSAYHHP